jgi:hypothetical protein
MIILAFQLRYIIEASLLHAKLLNRVLVLPSFVYARSCEVPMQVLSPFDCNYCLTFDYREVCSDFGLFVERSEVVG